MTEQTIDTCEIAAKWVRTWRHRRAWARACERLDRMGVDQGLVDQVYTLGIENAGNGWRLYNELQYATRDELAEMNQLWRKIEGGGA